ncbi:FAD-linked oxidoreductase-like protein [Xylaria venustula]|nr:FAD-linked oxidoreductase-like protein [Xylaria venustula]
MSSITRRLIRNRRVNTLYYNNHVSLGGVTTIKSEWCDRLPQTWVRSRHFYHSNQVSISSTIDRTDGNFAGTRAGISSPTPLSTLPMPVLLRSLLVATVSSKPYLLGPSLSIVSFLSKPNRSFLFSIDRNPLIHWLVKRTLYDHFCIGENAEEVTKNMKRMHEFGISGVLLTYAKETTFDHKSKSEHVPGSVLQKDDTIKQKCEEIEAWRTGTLQTVHMTGDGDQVAVKMTGAGPLATEAFTAGQLPPKQMMDALDEICQAARQAKSRIVIDAESQRFQRGIARTTVMLMRKHNTEQKPLVYHTYQCYLKGTRERLAKDLALAAQEGWTIGVKLVRGAYMSTDERSKIHDSKEETDRAYDSIVRDLLRRDMDGFGGSKMFNGGSFPRMGVLLATHNKKTVLAAHKLHQEIKEAVPLEFAQLHGMADSLSFSLLGAKNAQGDAPRVLKCSTWGPLSECVAYLIRRAIENREAVSRTQDEFKAVKAEFNRRLLSRIGL